MLTCPTRGESGSNLPGAWCPKIAPSPMVTQRAVANFSNGFDESLQMRSANFLFIGLIALIHNFIQILRPLFDPLG